VRQNLGVVMGAAHLMTRMRELAETTSKELGVSVFPYHYSYITNEGLLHTFTNTMWTLGIAVISIVVVTLIFLPQPFMVRSLWQAKIHR
jgi:hypothetical protein